MKRLLLKITLMTMVISLFCQETSLILLSNSSTRLDLIKKAFQRFEGRYILFVSKKEFLLYVYGRKERAIEKFKIGYGFNPDKKAKLYEGDMRTPEGIYRIVEILSLDADKNSVSYKKLKAMNDEYLKKEDGFYRFDNKNIDIGRNAYGPRFFRLNYPNKNDEIRYKKACDIGLIPFENGKIRDIGCGIGIHGNNYPPSIGKLASAGCILMDNRDVVKLHSYIIINTPVIISSE